MVMLGGGLVTRHFALREFRSRDGADVPRMAFTDLEALCRQLLEPLRSEFGPVLITSGYRSKLRNEAVGGAPRSFHRYDIKGRYGVAADFMCSHGTPIDWYDFLAARSAGGLGVYEDFVHVDNRRKQARWSG